MKDFVFHIPTKIVFGKNAQEKVGKELVGLGKNVLILYGSDRIHNTGFLGQIEANIEKEGIHYVAMGGVQENPSLEFVARAIQFAKEQQVDAILAIGGGSVIDTAKSVSMGIKTDHSVWAFFEGKEEPKEAVPVGVILTMAATASEANPVAVLTNEQLKRKNAYAHPLMYPAFALLNPELTYTVSKRQTAIGAIDIFAHAFERYFHLEQQGTLRNKLCAAVMTTIMDELPKVLELPDNYDGRSQIMWAATMAHSDMIGTEGVFACHEMSHVLTEIFGMAHGEALAVLMPAWCRYMIPKQTAYVAAFARNIWGVDAYLDDLSAAAEGVRSFENFMQACGLPVSMQEAGITEFNSYSLAEILLEGREYVGEAFEPVYLKDAAAIFELCRG